MLSFSFRSVVSALLFDRHVCAQSDDWQIRDVAAYFIRHAVSYVWRGHGGGNPAHLLPGLRAIFQHEPLQSAHAHAVPSTLLVDVGAHEGDITASMLQLFFDTEGRRHHVATHRTLETFVSKFREPVGVLAFEPSPSTFTRFAERHRRQEWDMFGVCALRAGLGNTSTLMKFYDMNDSDSSQASTFDNDHVVGYKLNEKAHNAELMHLTSLDDCFYNDFNSDLIKVGSSCSSQFRHDAPIFAGPALSDEHLIPEEVYLLKIDAQGYDDQILHGAQRFLTENIARFILFEYEYAGPPRSREAQRSLGSTVAFLWNAGYVCFLILERILVPVSDIFWRDFYDVASLQPAAQHSDFICGRVHDEGVDSLVHFFGGSPYAPRASELAMLALEFLRRRALVAEASGSTDIEIRWRTAEEDIAAVEIFTNLSARRSGRDPADVFFFKVQEMLLLGQLSARGDARRELRKWYLRAEALGCKTATLELGMLEHFHGHGPLQFARERAISLYRSAVANGDRIADAVLRELRLL